MQTGFNAGELSPRMAGRVDKPQYGLGCYKLENFIPDIAGPAIKRGGTQWIQAVKTLNKRAWLVSFERSATDSFMLEFGDGYIRFFTNRAQLQVSGVPAYNGATAYLIGDLVSSAGVNYYAIADTTGNAPPNATYWYQLTGTIYEIPSPYTLAQLTNSDGSFAISYVQSGDVIYLAHRSHKTRKLSRYGTTDWTLTEYQPTGGPFQDVNVSATTVYSSASTGVVTLTASTAIFTAAQVGTLFYLEQQTVSGIMQWETAKAVAAAAVRRSDGRNYSTTAGGTTGSVRPTHTEGVVSDGDTGVLWTFLDAGYGWARITAVGGGGTTATATVLSRIPNEAVGAGNASTKWALGAWSDTEGWPDAVTFYLDRLVFGRDSKVWMTVAGDYENMQARDFGRQTTESAISMTIPSRRGNRILWMETLEVGLVVATGKDEWVITPASKNDPLGPLNIAANPLGAVGSRAVAPVRLFDSIVHVQRSGRKLRDQRYINGEGGVRVDLNAFADHITSRFVSLANTAEPYAMIWGVGSDGGLTGAMYYPEQESLGWARFPLDGVVECVATIPSPDGQQDDLWLIIKRTINGAETRYVEVMKPPLGDADDQEDAFYVDSGVTYDGATTTAMTGAGHLVGKTVNVLVDGATHPQRVVQAGGTFTLQIAGSKVHFGLPFTGKIATMDLEAGSSNGTSQGKVKRIHKGIIRLQRTLGGKAGPSETKLDTLQFRDAVVPMGSPPPLFTGDKQVPWPGGSDRSSRMWFVHEDPLPATVVAFMPQMATEDG